MHKLLNFYRLINILSIDVALGAICCAAWFAKVFNVQLRPYALLSLGFTVWIIYTADHLMDALSIKKEASTERHRFHQIHFKALAICLCVAVIIDLSLLFFIRAKILHTGFVLAGIVLLYLLINRWLGFVKEFVIAIVYCGGVLLPALSLKSSFFTVPEVLLLISFFITALINLIIFSRYDVHADKLDGYNSFALKFGQPATQTVLSILFGMQAMIIILLFMVHVWNCGFLLSLMNGVLFLLFLKPSYFNKQDSYRLCGDAVFLFPAIFLLFG
jgi:4-hydroxybenzoate polyprenyltransferase